MKHLNATLVLALAVGSPVGSMAHEVPGAPFQAYAFPSYALPTIDGDLSDWGHVSNWFVLSEDTTVGDWGLDADSDPEDFDARCMVGWNREANRIYVAVQIADDVFHNRRVDPTRHEGDDSVNIIIDADHSGGFLFDPATRDEIEGDMSDGWYSTGGQRYTAQVPPIDGWWLFMPNEEPGIDWLTDGRVATDPDYLEVAWSRSGPSGGSGVYSYEFKITPWLTLDPRGAAFSTEHQLEPDQILHVGFLFEDYDDADSKAVYAFPPSARVVYDASFAADFVTMEDDGDCETNICAPGDVIVKLREPSYELMDRDAVLEGRLNTGLASLDSLNLQEGIVSMRLVGGRDPILPSSRGWLSLSFAPDADLYRLLWLYTRNDHVLLALPNEILIIPGEESSVPPTSWGLLKALSQ